MTMIASQSSWDWILELVIDGNRWSAILGADQWRRKKSISKSVGVSPKVFWPDSEINSFIANIKLYVKDAVLPYPLYCRSAAISQKYRKYV